VSDGGIGKTGEGSIERAGETGSVPEGWEDTPDGVHQDLVDGMLYMHNRVNSTSTKLLDSMATFTAAVELLAERGLISIEELEARKQTVAEQLAQSFVEDSGVILMEADEDKYDFKHVADVDCVARIPYCQAACCSLDFALSRQDVEEGIIRWDLGDPYMSRREADGHCHHLDRTTRFCSVRDARPIPCRAYTCRNDKRIWKDFEKMEIQPNLEAMTRMRLRARDLVRLRPGSRVREPMQSPEQV
jgi:Fe-S-cluster containining protein